MKIRLVFLCLFISILTLFVSCTSDNKGTIKATLSVDNANFTGVCPHDFVFTGLLESDQITSLSYVWERSTGNSAPQSIFLSSPGGVIVQDTLRLTATGTATEVVHITAPDNVISNQITVTAVCQ